jgi:hypothetical protein
MRNLVRGYPTDLIGPTQAGRRAQWTKRQAGSLSYIASRSVERCPKAVLLRGDSRKNLRDLHASSLQDFLLTARPSGMPRPLRVLHFPPCPPCDSPFRDSLLTALTRSFFHLLVSCPPSPAQTGANWIPATGMRKPKLKYGRAPGNAG